MEAPLLPRPRTPSCALDGRIAVELTIPFTAPAVTAYGTAPTFCRPKLTAPTCTSTHVSGLFTVLDRLSPWMNFVHVSMSGTEKRPCTTAVCADTVLHNRVPAVASSKRLIV